MDLERIVTILRRRVGLIVACVLLFGGAAFGLSILQEKEYTATASLLFRNPGFAEDLFGSSATAVSPDPNREAATNVKLVGLDVIAERTAERLNGLSTRDVSEMVSASAAGESDVVSVSAISTKPAQAMRVANVFARQFIAFRAAADKSKLLQAKNLAEREYQRLSPAQQAGVRGQALSRAAERLGILASLQTGNAELVQPADLPTSPTSPKPLRNGLLGIILGLFVGFALAFLLEQLNRQLRSPEEVSEVFGLPILGTVPESKAILSSNDGVEAMELPFMENEAFRMLRASLRYFNVDHDMRTLLVTSHEAGVGKSTTAWNTARVAATSSKVILVETDLRNPALARQHGLAVGPGLAELLTHQVELDTVIQAKPLPGGSNGSVRHLDVIVAGSVPPNPAELIESQAMRELLSQLTERYELVVVDTAPIGVVSDAFPLLRQVDGLIVVARLGQTTRDHAQRLREQLNRLEAPALGAVANGVKLRRGGKYGYGYYGAYASAEPPSAVDRTGASKA